MRMLVIGVSPEQLEKWKDQQFTQGALRRKHDGTVQVGGDTYHFLVSKPYDDRVRGMEFEQLFILDGAIDYAGQYSLRVRN